MCIIILFIIIKGKLLSVIKGSWVFIIILPYVIQEKIGYFIPPIK